MSTEPTRNDRIVGLMPVVRGNAARILNVWPGIADWDDLVSDGWLGAIKAVDDWRPEKGAALRNYAYRRVRGEMLDGIRRRRSKKIQLETSLEWAPVVQDTDETLTLADVLPDSETAVTDMVDSLVIGECLPFLPPREARILQKYYWEGMTLAAIGASEGVTESRICQVLTRSRIFMYQMLTDSGRQADEMR